MRSDGKMTLGQVVVLVVALAIAFTLALAIIIPALRLARKLANQGVCQSNLNSINKALVLYRSANNNQWPWLYDKTPGWGTAQVGTNRNLDPHGPNDDPNNPRPRSITALMFLLVRSGQASGIFRCPMDESGMVDDNTKAGEDDGDVKEGDSYWDFSRPENVSYSWQAPVWGGGRYSQSIDSAAPDAVIMGDMTPAATNTGWKPMDVSGLTDRAARSQNSPNHSGEYVNVLRVAGNVRSERRPDVGVGSDNIYTASDDPNAGSRSATSLDIQKHRSTQDTFLIGPVGR